MYLRNVHAACWIESAIALSLHIAARTHACPCSGSLSELHEPCSRLTCRRFGTLMAGAGSHEAEHLTWRTLTLTIESGAYDEGRCMLLNRTRAIKPACVASSVPLQAGHVMHDQPSSSIVLASRSTQIGTRCSPVSAVHMIMGPSVRCIRRVGLCLAKAFGTSMLQHS